MERIEETSSSSGVRSVLVTNEQDQIWRKAFLEKLSQQCELLRKQRRRDPSTSRQEQEQPQPTVIPYSSGSFGGMRSHWLFTFTSGLTARVHRLLSADFWNQFSKNWSQSGLTSAFCSAVWDLFKSGGWAGTHDSLRILITEWLAELFEQHFQALNWSMLSRCLPNITISLITTILTLAVRCVWNCAYFWWYPEERAKYQPANISWSRVVFDTVIGGFASLIASNPIMAVVVAVVTSFLLVAFHSYTQGWGARLWRWLSSFWVAQPAPLLLPLDDQHPSWVPLELQCPITHALFEEPVISPDGVVYERAAILQWLASNHPSDPMTRESLRAEELIPCPEIASLVKEFTEHNPCATVDQK